MKKKDYSIYIGTIYNENVLILESFQKSFKNRNRSMFHCKCLRCGKEFDSCVDDIFRKDKRKILSCGCFQKEKASEIGRKTGANNIINAHKNPHRKWEHKVVDKEGKPTPIYVNYRGMISRCYNKNDKSYALYNGNGICVYEPWKDFDVYYKWAVENGYKDGYETHRLNNYEGYCPHNVVYLSDKQHNYITAYMKKNKLSEMKKDEIFSILIDNNLG